VRKVLSIIHNVVEDVGKQTLCDIICGSIIGGNFSGGQFSQAALVFKIHMSFLSNFALSHVSLEFVSEMFFVILFLMEKIGNSLNIL
jgi:hypothetical protein